MCCRPPPPPRLPRPHSPLIDPSVVQTVLCCCVGVGVGHDDVITVEQVQAASSSSSSFSLNSSLSRVYEVTIRNPSPRTPTPTTKGRRRKLLLILPQYYMVRLLRCEQLMVGAEAVVVGWVRAVDDTTAATTTTPRGETMRQRRRQGEEEIIDTASLLRFLPTIIASSQTRADDNEGMNGLGCPYTILEPTRGTPLAALLSIPGPGGQLTREERQSVDGQTARLFRRLATLTSPSGRFGPASLVLADTTDRTTTKQQQQQEVLVVDDTPVPSSWTQYVRTNNMSTSIGRGGVQMIGNSISRGGGQTVGGGVGVVKEEWGGGNRVGLGGTRGMNRGGGGGASHWSIAFHSMLEGILRDGEDMTIMMPYGAIRRHFRRLAWVLDAVTVPRLVAVDGSDERNVLVDMVDDDGDNKPREEEDQDQREEQEEEESEEDEDEEKEEGGDDKEESRSRRRRRRKLVVTGLRDWSNCIFGDPLFATVFSSPSPSPEFLEGFDDDGNANEDQVGGGGPGVGVAVLGRWFAGTDGDDDDSDLIQDRQTAHLRILLYRVYHATVAVVREFYRPHGSESTKRELEARKRLNEVLVQLEAIQIQEQQPSRDMGQKREEVEEGDKGKGGQRSRQHPRPSGEVSPAKRAKTEELEEDQQ